MTEQLTFLQALIVQLDDLYAKKRVVAEEFSDLLQKTFFGDGGTEDMSIVRVKGPMKGKTVVIDRRSAFDEWMQLGPGCEAEEAIYRDFPRVKELKALEAEHLEAIKTFETEKFGFHHKEFTLQNLLKMIVFVHENQGKPSEQA